MYSPPPGRTPSSPGRPFSARKTSFSRSIVRSLIVFALLLTAAGGAFAATTLSHLNAARAAASNTAVLTYKNDTLRSGQDPNETTLNISNVNPFQFGKRVSYPVDDQVYAQPLYVPNLTINGNQHNVVFVATENDSLYAFDADATGSAPAPLWKTSFLINGALIVTNTDVSCNDLVPHIGITSTPVIDPNTNTMYVVVYTKDSNGKLNYRLHAIDITTGLEKPGSPILIQASAHGSGVGGSGGVIPFDPTHERQRAALLLADGQVYMAFSSFCDNNFYHGWILGYTYNGSAFQQAEVYNDTANGTQGGIWGSGGALSADSNGNIFYTSGNGTFDLNSSNGVDAGDSFVRLNAQLQVQDYFTPFNQICLDVADLDLGSGGPLLVPGQNEIIGGGKEGRIYVVNASNMGKFNTISNVCNNQGPTNVDKIVQELPPHLVGGIYSSPAYWNGSNGQYVYFTGVNDHGKAFQLTNGRLSTSAISQTPESFGFTGGNASVSSNSTTAGTGIVWIIDPAHVLRAYDATNLNREIYNSAQNSARDGLDSYVKFSTPTIANGEVFVGTQKALTIYGQLSQPDNIYNNAGVSDDSNPSAANFDGGGSSYSAQALKNVGIIPGSTITTNSVNFTWPNVPSGGANNWQANGQTIPVSPVSNANTLAFLGSATNGNASGTATITYTDATTQTFTLGFSDWTLNGGTTQPAFGNSKATTTPYRNTRSGKQTVNTYLFYAETPLQASKTIKSVTLPSSISGGQIHVFAISTRGNAATNAYNNVGISDDSNTATANFDGGSFSYSAQALKAAGIAQGGTVTFNGVSFTWPNVASGVNDNWKAAGQVIPVSPVSNANTLAFLGSSNNGPTSGTATITYTDATTQTFTLGFSDWTLNGGHAAPSFGNGTVATTAYRNCVSTGSNPACVNGRETVKTYVFYADIALQPGKTIQSVTLPSSVNQGGLHVFTISTKFAPALPAYNNVGISNDSNTKAGNYDGGGASYSAQALQSQNVAPGSTVTFNGVSFTWPFVASGVNDNWQTAGQVVPVNPVTNATTLAFLGSATNGPTSGTATITYTDGTTQTFTLGFSDWTLNAGHATPSFGNGTVVTTTYRNTSTGRETVKTYVFYAQVTLQSGKTVKSVTLPSSVNQGHLHVFAVGTR